MRIRSGLIALVVTAAAMPAAHAAESFEGFYGGFTLGANKEKTKWYTQEVRYRNDTRLIPGDPDETDTYPDGTSIPGYLSDPEASFSDTAYGVGLVFGYNWQFENNVVVGIEFAAGSAPTYDRTVGAAPGLGDTTDDPVTFAAVKTAKPLVAGLTFGYVVVPDTLAYVRANYERMVVTGTISSTDCPSSNLNFDPGATPPTMAIPCDPDFPAALYSNSKKLYGWGYGLGVEHKFGETFALRLEYRRAEYGKTKSMTIMTETDNNFGADALLDVQKANIVELGLIFHF